MNIFCSGIGGIGLSAYAAHMHAQGHIVSGSDKSTSTLIEDLRSQGIMVYLKQDGSALPEALDLLVYSEAIPESAPERALAKERGVKQISYFHALGEMMEGKNLIAVCGTHGKSSTTAMVARVLIQCGLDPNVVVGTKMKELNGRNWRSAKSDLWVVEACEYRCSFHYLSPSTILMTNADGDHYDAFATQEAYEEAFVIFLKKLPLQGRVVTHGSDPRIRAIVKRAGVTMIDADMEEMVTLETPGRHMQQNAQLALSLARHFGIPMERAVNALRGFSGSWRRMEVKGTTVSGAQIIDDYAHHPVEIAATLDALKERYIGRRIVCVFQPHTHDRTLKLWNYFAKAFADADLLILLPVYDARPDTEKEMVDDEKLKAAIEQNSSVEIKRAASLDEAKNMLSTVLQPDDVLVTMGAGSITKLSEMMKG